MRSFLIKIFDLFIPPRKNDALIRHLSKTDFPLIPFHIEKTDPHTIGLIPFQRKEVRACIHEAKYFNNIHALTLLGKILSEYLHEYNTEETALEYSSYVLIPMPVYKKRSYNHIHSLLSHTLLPDAMSVDGTILSKTRDTKKQAHMNKVERLKNQENVFSSKVCDPRTHYLLIDDVITTGATMNSALSTLKNAGAVHITPIALAY